MTDCYQVTGTEGAYEPGSSELVLRNLADITSSDDMDELALRLVGNGYAWAGQERSVNLGKGGCEGNGRLSRLLADVMAVQAGVHQRQFNRRSS